MILSVDHMTINMKDKDASFRFYGDVLGLEKLNTVDLGDHCLYYYQLPGNNRLELIEYYFDTQAAEVGETTRGTIRHFAFAVDHLTKLQEVLLAEGIRILEGPKRNEKLGCHFMLIRDPNGCELEFVEKF